MKLRSQYTYPIIYSLFPICIAVIVWKNWGGDPGLINVVLPFFIIGLIIALCSFLFLIKDIVVLEDTLIIQYPLNRWMEDIKIPMKEIQEVQLPGGRITTIIFKYTDLQTSDVKESRFLFDMNTKTRYDLFDFLRSKNIKLSGRGAETYFEDIKTWASVERQERGRFPK
jgi:hypothetical protein